MCQGGSRCRANTRPKREFPCQGRHAGTGLARGRGLRNSNSAGDADITVQYGPPNSVPAVGDFDANGTTTIGVYETATRTFYLRNSNSTGNADITVQYGPNGCVPVIGDFDGNMASTLGVYETSTRTFYFRNSTTGGNADIQLSYGPNAAIPLVGDWDGQ